MCKELPVTPVNKVVDLKRIIRKNGGPRRRRGTRGCWPPKKIPLLLWLDLCNGIVSTACGDWSHGS
jgi:hypothetical protein